MTRIRKLMGWAAALCLTLGLLPQALAEAPTPPDDERFRDKSWEQVVDELLEESHVKAENVAIGYYNTVTGEEHYLNGEDYLITASMFKVPLNMLFTEKIANGEMDWDTRIGGIAYSTLLDSTILHSSNSAAETLWKSTGSYRSYRELICPYMGVDPETADPMYWKNNYFTAREMIHCLKTLWEGGEARFPRLIDTMKKAEPKRFFMAHEQPVEIAHKYGYFTESWHEYINDCAICFTDDPICIVLFTDTIRTPGFLADFCTRMCEYTAYHTALRKLEEARLAEEAAIRSLNGGGEAGGEGELAGPAAVDGGAAGGSGRTAALGKGLAALLILAGAVLLCLRAGRLARDGKLRLVWADAAVILAALTLLVGLFSESIGLLLNRPKGDPQAVVTGFFDALEAGDYPAAYACLDGYTGLGLENEPDSEAGQLVMAALRRSWDCRLHGDCAVVRGVARQQLVLRHLDLPALEADLKQAADEAMARIARERPRSEIYDEEGNYLDEVVQAAYTEAFRSLLEDSDRYTAADGLELELRYGAEGWRITVSPELLAALSGNTVTGKGGEGA